MNLERVSPALEKALEQARQLAEERNYAVITPEHLLCVLAAAGAPLVPVLERIGCPPAQLRDRLAGVVGDKAPTLTSGRRATASRALREGIERAFAWMEARGAAMAEPVDFLCALTETRDESLKQTLRAFGITGAAIARCASARDSAGDVPSEKVPIAVPGSAGMLLRYGRDLTEAAAKGELMPTVGRDDEIRRVIQTLLRKTKNNPVLVGDPGTGKTAVVEGLANRIAAGDAPESLRKCRVVALDLTALVAGAKYRGEFEERIKTVIEEVRARKGEIILFLDELHTLVGAGGSEGGMDAANILKPALARGELHCVGATTYDEYRERIEKDGALARRFDVVHVKEPDNETMIAILRGIRSRYEAFHGVRLTEESLQAAIKLSRRYIRNRFLPDKAIDVIDEATARIRMQRESKPNEIDQIERLLGRKEAELATMREQNESGPALSKLEAEIEEMTPRIAAWRNRREILDRLRGTKQAIAEQNQLLVQAESGGEVAKAASIRYGALKYLEEQRADLERQAAAFPTFQGVPEVLGAEHVAEVVAERVGVPIQRLLESERDRLLKLEERIGSRVLGQEEAVAAVADASRRMRTDIRIGSKPNSFLFVGPTGVGKTELAKALAQALFDDEMALIRIDMGEYKDSSASAGLIGSRPGLVGSDEGGFLTEQVRHMPYSVVLFDEIEKAHPQVLDLLLGVLDEGRLTDAKGRFCDFSNSTIIFTSNLGVREANDSTGDPERRREIILEVVKSHLRPEFFNRISQVVVFHALTQAHLEQIVRVHLVQLARKVMDERAIQLEVTPAAVAYLAEQSYDPDYGARPVERTLQRLVLSPLASALIAGDIRSSETVNIDFAGGEVSLSIESGAAAIA